MPEQHSQFRTTHWSVVLAAGQSSTQASLMALETLCTTYWYPLYAYIRRRGYGVEEAQDLTQEFFTRILEKNVAAALTPDKGRFRSYLLTALNHFLVNEWEHRTAQKRGGKERLQLDLEKAESAYMREAAEHLTPEKIYDRRWACEVLDRGLAELEDEYRRAGKLDAFETFQHCLWDDPEEGLYLKFAQSAGVTESAARSAAHRMRKRYGQVLRNQIAHTVGSEAEIDEELTYLFNALAAR